MKFGEFRRNFGQVCCDLNHPNLVRLLGYADHPRLLLVHELLEGGPNYRVGSKI